MVRFAPTPFGGSARTHSAATGQAGERKPFKEQLMARTVHCRRYGEDLEGLERPPLPGAKGQDIFDNVSKKAWLEWQGHQTILIN